MKFKELASETTFRSVIIRSGLNDVAITNLKKAETFQTGDIPIPSYGSSLIRIPEMDDDSRRVAIKIGGAVLRNRGLTDVEVLFSSSPMWEEESSDEIHILYYNIAQKVFTWKRVTVDLFEPRAFHSAAKIGNFVSVFGGLDIIKKQRHSINPVRISVIDWTVSDIEISGLHGYLSGAGIATSGLNIFNKNGISFVCEIMLGP